MYVCMYVCMYLSYHLTWKRSHPVLIHSSMFFLCVIAVHISTLLKKLYYFIKITNIYCWIWSICQAENLIEIIQEFQGFHKERRKLLKKGWNRYIIMWYSVSVTLQHHDITEILLKVALNTITINLPIIWLLTCGLKQKISDCSWALIAQYVSC